jgi:tetratricopeptide (TPR) repeat protein
MSVDHLHSLVATGQFLAAYREVERLALDPDVDPTDRARIYIHGIRAAAGLREIYSAVKMAEKAVEAAELGSNWDDIGNARLHSALIYRELGDSAQALRFFQLFFQHLDRYSSLHTKTPFAQYNLALTHQQRREYADALRNYGLAAEGFQQLGRQSDLLACLQNSAWVMLLQSQPAEAEPFLLQAETLCAQLESPPDQAFQLVVEALYARQLGNLDRAMSLCEEIFQPGRQGVTELHLADAAWIMADLTLEASRLHEAQIFADLAINHALHAKEPNLMNLASEVRQRVRAKQSELRA